MEEAGGRRCCRVWGIVMAARRTSHRRRGDSAEQETAARSGRISGPMRRILLVVSSVCAAGAGLLAVGSWQTCFLPDAPQPSPPSSDLRVPVPAPISADRPRPTPEQLVAEVRQLAERLLATLPHDPQALVLAGRIYYAFNDVTRADDCWQSCLRLHPSFAEAQCAVAEAAWEHGDFEQAAQRFNEVFAGNPQLSQQQVFCLADALMNLGRASEAVTVLERSAEHHPLPPFGLLLLAHACVESGQYQKALQQFSAVLAANPRSAKAHFGLATVYAQLGNPVEARRYREQYGKLQKDELAESARLRPEMRKADWADPIPVVRESYLNAGKVFAALNELDETEKLWRRAAELDPASPRPRQLLELLGRPVPASGGRADEG